MLAVLSLALSVPSTDSPLTPCHFAISRVYEAVDGIEMKTR
jgi:hypothetical protein